MRLHPPTTCFHCTFAILCSLALVVSCGCQREGRAPKRGGRVVSTAEKNRNLLEIAGNELSQLPEQAITDLRPPTVVLDAMRSSDGQDVMATLDAAPRAPRGVYNVIKAPNGRFKAIGILPGDTVKYYINQQSELANEFGGGDGRLTLAQINSILKLPEDQRNAVAESMAEENQGYDGDIITTSAVDLTVAQVIDNSTLMLEEAFAVPIEQPMRLEIIRFRDQRFRDLRVDRSQYAEYGVPRLGWEPTPDRAAVQQMVERLNKWLRQTTANVDWSPTALLQTLSDELRDEKMQVFLGDEALARKAFSLASDELRATQAVAYEGRLLQEASWCRDIGRWLTEDEVEMLPRVDRLFEWTVRNLQLDVDDAESPAYRPWHAMVMGHANARGRAWVFAQLCRQWDVPVVIVRPAGEGDWLWCGALIEGQIYLYDPQLGMRLPGPNGRTATLADLREDASLLAAFDLHDKTYWPSDKPVEKVDCQIVAGAFSLTRRAALVTERLTTDESLLLSVDVDEVAEQLAELEGVRNVTLWPYPYEVLRSQLTQGRRLRTLAAIEFDPFVYKPQLWKARLLYFRGRSGKANDGVRGRLAGDANDHRDAGQLYTSQRVRPRDSTIAKLEDDDTRKAWTAAKQRATYWLGLLSYDRGEPGIALNWLKLAQKSDTWQQGALYNRARALQAQGNQQQAIELLQQSDRIANQVLAKSLLGGAKATSADETDN